METNRVHPIMIASNLRRVLYLTVIPVARGFFSALRGGLVGWLHGAWIDLLVLVLMLLFAALRWYFTRYRCDGRGICVKTGALLWRQTFTPWERVVTLSVVEPFYLRPFGAVRLRADTIGGSLKGADIALLLSQRQAGEVLLHKQGTPASAAQSRYAPRTGSIVALSLLTSNALAGIVFFAAFVSQSGKLLGKGFSRTLIGTMEEFARGLAFGIPPAAAAIGYCLLLGWFIGFVLSFLRYKNFSVTRRQGILDISGGLFTHRQYSIRRQHVNFIDIRQSVATKALRLYSLYISAAGYGKEKNDISCVIPTEKEHRFWKNAALLFPGCKAALPCVKPPPGGYLRFIWKPLLYMPGMLALLFWCARRFPQWADFLWFVGLMSLLPAVWYLEVQWMDFRSGGVGERHGYYTLRYSSGFLLHTVIIPATNIVQIELRQSFFQKFGSQCDLIVNARAEGHSLHLCRNLNKRALEDLFGRHSVCH